MNPLVLTQVKEINRQIEALRSALANHKAKLEQTADDRERLLKETWRERKEVATLQRMAQDYDALDAENKHLKETVSELQDRLRQVLTHLKALAAEFRS